MVTVCIAKCSDYQYEQVEKAVFQCLDGMPSISQRIKPQSKVLVKVNLLRGNPPQDAITTHPSVVQAIVTYMQKLGCQVLVGDSPGSALNYDEKSLRTVYEITGMSDVARNTGCLLNYDTSVVEVSNSEGEILKKMRLIKVVQDVDFVVSAAKLKTHALMTYTGAVKNLYGVIPGRTKIDYHLKMSKAENFAAMLVDICEYVKPVFSVIDAVEGMEGDGPAAGDKRHAGLIFASENPYAVDLAAIHTIGVTPEDVPTMVNARVRNIFSGNLSELEIKGAKFDEIHIAPFRYPATKVSEMGGLSIRGVPKFIQKYVMEDMRPKPIFHENLCVACGVCVESCPPKALSLVNRKPKLNSKQCIRCFCCHELCPKKAVHIKSNWLYERILK